MVSVVVTASATGPNRAEDRDVEREIGELHQRRAGHGAAGAELHLAGLEAEDRAVRRELDHAIGLPRETDLGEHAVEEGFDLRGGHQNGRGMGHGDGVGYGEALELSSLLAGERTMSMNAARAVDLDEAAVRRFLAAFGDMRALLRRQDRTGPARRPRSPTDEGFSAFARDARVRSEVLAVLTKHGFADVGAWEAAVQAVTTAVAFADPDSGLARHGDHGREGARGDPCPTGRCATTTGARCSRSSTRKCASSNACARPRATSRRCGRSSPSSNRSSTTDPE